MIKTKITEMFEKTSIVQGGCVRYFAEMAAAVSNAGLRNNMVYSSKPKDLANEIARCKDMTNKPIGNLTFLGFSNQITLVI